VICFFETIENKKKNSRIELAFKQQEDTSEETNVEMKIIIKTNSKEIQNIFHSIHQSVRLFIKKWIVYVTENIKVLLHKKSRLNKSTKNSLNISLNIKDKNPLKSPSSIINCAFCGISFSFDNQTLECDKCNKKKFSKKKKK
jgi:rubrerythrin